MKFIADLHVHSYLSRATSKRSDLVNLHAWAQRKGISVVGTGDFTHPEWRRRLRDELVEAEPGLFRLSAEKGAEKRIGGNKAGILVKGRSAERSESAERSGSVERSGSAERSGSHETRRRSRGAYAYKGPVRFMLQTEISSIYKWGDKVRKVHNLVYMPDIESAELFSRRLGELGNVESDGRPILGLDSRDLLEIVLESSGEAFLIPAHIWTPWFSVLGSKSGFDAIEECYRDLTEHVFALETGLSSDPAMNWRLSKLDRFTLVSNSDAHSPPRLGREANLFDCEFSYHGIMEAIRTRRGFLGTIEFFPEEGKYHADGHRKCGLRMMPEETLKRDGLCPVCGRKVTMGVLHRVQALADRKEGSVPPGGGGHFECLVGLDRIISEVRQRGRGTKGVLREYEALLESLGAELFILREADLEDITRKSDALLAEGVRRVREGLVCLQPGFDGQYGTIRIF